MQEPILHLATGGTIDSEWDPVADTARPSTESFIPRYLQAIRIRHCVSEVLCMKDSREMGVQDQESVAGRVAETSSKRILVSTGTYLMPDIARRVEAHPMARFYEEIDRRVILMGARKPMKGYLMSDGGFNLGMAFALMGHKTIARVSLAMNGGCFQPGDVMKDLTAATFSSVDGADQMPFPAFDLITIGGTIDFIPDGMDQLVPAKESSIPGYLRNSVKMQRPFYAINPLVKDSRNLFPDDFKMILEIIRHAKSDYVLITMGIFKIRDLQQFLKKNMEPDIQKRIIITGARLPLAATDITDGTFNLGYAFGQLGFLEPGVHIALGGKIVEDHEEVLPLIYSSDEIDMMQKQSLS